MTEGGGADSARTEKFDYKTHSQNSPVKVGLATITNKPQAETISEHSVKPSKRLSNSLTQGGETKKPPLSENGDSKHEAK